MKKAKKIVSILMIGMFVLVSAASAKSYPTVSNCLEGIFSYYDSNGCGTFIAPDSINWCAGCGTPGLPCPIPCQNS